MLLLYGCRQGRSKSNHSEEQLRKDDRARPNSTTSEGNLVRKSWRNPVYLATMRNTKLVLLALLGACALPPPVPPTAEFLVSAGDQTYWVRSDNSGLKIRGSPLILARTGGRYYEIFVGEIDRSFPRALLSGERVFRRELATGDSTVIYDDTAIVHLSEEYHQQHPRARLLGPDDDPDDDVDITAVG